MELPKTSESQVQGEPGPCLGQRGLDASEGTEAPPSGAPHTRFVSSQHLSSAAESRSSGAHRPMQDLRGGGRDKGQPLFLFCLGDVAECRWVPSPQGGATDHLGREPIAGVRGNHYSLAT